MPGGPRCRDKAWSCAGRNDIRYRVRGKLEGGLFGTRRFSDEGTLELNAGR
jgi:hypothetical protein